MRPTLRPPEGTAVQSLALVKRLLEQSQVRLICVPHQLGHYSIGLLAPFQDCILRWTSKITWAKGKCGDTCKTRQSVMSFFFRRDRGQPTAGTEQQYLSVVQLVYLHARFIERTPWTYRSEPPGYDGQLMDV